ncbi:DUF5906 domain-containing protein [Roseovarius pacificus]|uniref:primase-helicase family protein n=1 Tax=Roseovarius pacificus TaxID=337701 RepID=UPI002A188A53|nr:DUF5906 domain-containing protein [Roseovarius pacificus]
MAQTRQKLTPEAATLQSGEANPMTSYKNPQSELRWALQQNGYRWVPNIGKRTRGLKWPEKALSRDMHDLSAIRWWDTAQVTDEETGEVREISNPSTGILVESDLVAMDVDVDNEDAVERLFDLACDLFGDTWEQEVLIRVREGSCKETWLFRLGDPKDPKPEDISFAKSRKFAGPLFYKPGSEPETQRDAESHKVEFFRGANCQIGAFGYHTLPGEKEAYPQGIEYEWRGNKSPLTVPRCDLPIVPYGAFREFVLQHEQVLEQMGWIKSLHANDTGDRPRQFTLDTSKTFYTGSKSMPEPVNYDDLEKGMPIRLAEVLGEDPAWDGSNPKRGFVTERHDGVLGVHDSESGITYYPPFADPDQVRGKALELGKKLRSMNVKAVQDAGELEGVGEAEESRSCDDDSAVIDRVIEMLQEAGVTASVEGDDETWETIFKAYKTATRDFADREGMEGYQVEARARLIALRYLYVTFPAGDPREKWQCLVPGKATQLRQQAFLDEFDDVAEIWIDPSDKTKGTRWASITKLFVESNLPVKIEGKRFVPWSSQRIAKNEHGYHVQNTYAPPELGTRQAELVQLYEDLLTHVFDRDDERKIFDECMSFKFLNPTRRGVTHVLVADGVEGVGRNTLVEAFLFSALGHPNCQLVDESKLKGSNGQSQFNAWLFDTLAFFVPEVKGIERSAWQSMKAMFEVHSAEITANVKYGVPRRDMVYGTMIIATNHRNALPLDLRTDNRRINVYDNGAKGPMVNDPDLKARVDAVREGSGVTPDMAASIVHYYTEVWPERHGAPREHVFMTASQTIAKTKSTEAAMKPTDEYLEMALSEVENAGRAYVTPGEVEARARKLAKTADAPSKVISLIASELSEQTSDSSGLNGWVKVFGASGGAKIGMTGGAKRVLAHGKAAAEQFLAMSKNDRAAALAASNVTSMTAEKLKRVKPHKVESDGS